MTTLGYARASTQDQNLYSQTDALTAAGQRDSSPDKITGKNASRPGITACIDYLPAGHVLLVHSTDRQDVGHRPAETIGAVDQQHVAGRQVVDARRDS